MTSFTRFRLLRSRDECWEWAFGAINRGMTEAEAEAANAVGGWETLEQRTRRQVATLAKEKKVVRKQLQAVLAETRRELATACAFVQAARSLQQSTFLLMQSIFLTLRARKMLCILERCSALLKAICSPFVKEKTQEDLLDRVTIIPNSYLPTLR